MGIILKTEYTIFTYTKFIKMDFIKELYDVMQDKKEYKFLGITYSTLEEMNAAVKAACDKLSKTIIKC